MMIEQKYNDVLFDIDDAILNELMPGFKEDYLILHSLLRKHNPKTVFEIGTHIGTGTEIICNAVPNAKVYSLDLPSHLSLLSKQHPISCGKGDIVGSTCKLNYNQVFGDSLKFEYINYLCEAYFVDGEHAYINVNHESTEIIKLKPKLIIYHDADMPDVYEGIRVAFDYTADYQLYRVTNTRIVYATIKN